VDGVDPSGLYGLDFVMARPGTLAFWELARQAGLPPGMRVAIQDGEHFIDITIDDIRNMSSETWEQVSPALYIISGSVQLVVAIIPGSQLPEIAQAGVSPTDLVLAAIGATSLKKGMDIYAAIKAAKVGKKQAEKLRRQFNTMRPELWKREAKENPHKYTPEQLSAMERGEAPIGSDGLPMEIHHIRNLQYGGSNDWDNLEFLTNEEHHRPGIYGERHPRCPK
jgi:hypothetical protein